MAEGQLEVPNKFIPSPALRFWLYGVVVATGGVLVATGVIEGTLWEQLDRLAAAVLMIGSGTTAMVNVPKPVK